MSDTALAEDGVGDAAGEVGEATGPPNETPCRATAAQEDVCSLMLPRLNEAQWRKVVYYLSVQECGLGPTSLKSCFSPRVHKLIKNYLKVKIFYFSLFYF